MGQKVTASIVAAAMFLTIAGLTGCTSSEEEESSGVAVLNENNEGAGGTAAVPGELTTAAIGENCSFYTDYDSFAADFATKIPDKTLIAPDLSSTTDWTIAAISLDTDAGTYQYTMNCNTSNATLTIDYNCTYDSAQAYCDAVDAGEIDALQATLFDEDNCIIKKSGATILASVTGDKTSDFELEIVSYDGNDPSDEELVQFRTDWKL